MPVRVFALTVTLAVTLVAPAAAFPVNFGPGFTTRSVTVDGCRISATVGGHGPAVVLLHGYAEDSRMWKPLAVSLSSRFTVIAPDLPGIGNSSIPSSGLDMSTRRVVFAMRSLRSAIATYRWSGMTSGSWLPTRMPQRIRARSNGNRGATSWATAWRYSASTATKRQIKPARLQPVRCA
jgi:pimeloyl-ACP methyl ester carboxylesterase